jgi:aerobic-type carbon monoxide dehydrogenase small subunit (CoxS/CutS family)
MKVTVNGKEHTIQVGGNPSLLEVLREQLDLTGAKYGCGEGACGACKVLVNGSPVPSCITPVTAVQDKKIITVEGLEKNGKLHRVQQAFLTADAFQCGYCAPGMVIAAVALLDKNPRPSEQEIKEALHGNICRCCTYPQIVQAVRQIPSQP